MDRERPGKKFSPQKSNWSFWLLYAHEIKLNLIKKSFFFPFFQRICSFFVLCAGIDNAALWFCVDFLTVQLTLTLTMIQKLTIR